MFTQGNLFLVEFLVESAIQLTLMEEIKSRAQFPLTWTSVTGGPPWRQAWGRGLSNV